MEDNFEDKTKKRDRPYRGGYRESNIELFRMLTMLVIVAHHYVVNSGLIQLVYDSGSFSGNDVFLLLFGWGGKTGINCFILITGYYMCRSQITAGKFFRQLGEYLFYNMVFFLVFTVTGYQPFSWKEFVKAVFPFWSVRNDFTSCYLLFYLFIPFLNKLLGALDEQEHIKLTAFALLVYTVLPSIPKFTVEFNYVTWFSVLYLIVSYIRLYPKPLFSSGKAWKTLTAVSLLLSFASVIVMGYLGKRIGKPDIAYFFVSDSNKILAVISAVCAFLLFKNLKMRHHRLINTVASSTFGVLLIHANSDTMRRWLWKDTLRNVNFYGSHWLPLHAAASVCTVFILCVCLDQVRMRLLEKPAGRALKKSGNRLSS